MSFTDKRLCNPTQLTTSGQTLYTVPASKTCIIKQVVVTNTTSSAATFSLFIGSAATPNALFSATSVAANDTIIINLSQVLAQNEILTGLASSNSTLNITISGVENDGPLNPVSTYIADSSITTAKLADSSVSTAKIINNSVNQSKLSTNLSGITITTSSLRSTDVPSPFEGQVIYESDTDRVLVWNNSAWVDPSTGKAERSGLVKIIPSSATNGTLATNGDVSISAQSTVNINGCFTSGFLNYRIMFSDLRIVTSNQDFQFQLRSGGSTATASNYSWGQINYDVVTTVFSQSGANPATSATISRLGAGNFTVINMDIFEPFQAKQTGATWDSAFSNGYMIIRKGGFIHTLSTSYDGFTISVPANTFSGTVSVYGYN
jgi:hypothetical protein